MSTDLFQATSINIAASIESRASEIVAAAKLYQRMPVHRDDLAAALESLMEALEYHMGVFTRVRATEADHAPQE